MFHGGAKAKGDGRHMGSQAGSDGGFAQPTAMNPAGMSGEGEDHVTRWAKSASIWVPAAAVFQSTWPSGRTMGPASPRTSADQSRGSAQFQPVNGMGRESAANSVSTACPMSRQAH